MQLIKDNSTDSAGGADEGNAIKHYSRCLGESWIQGTYQTGLGFSESEGTGFTLDTASSAR